MTYSTRWFVVAKEVSLDELGKELNEILDEFKDISLEETNKAIRKSVISVWGQIIDLTPVDEGRARSNWFMGPAIRSTTKDSTSDKGRSYVVARSRNINFLEQTMYLYNNLPYINMLEYGGYSTERKSNGKGKKVSTKSGKSVLKNPPVTSTGYSSKAPKGMVRLSLLDWNKTINKNFSKAKI